MIFRTALTLACAAGLAGFATAAPYNDGLGRFTVEVPDQWQAIPAQSGPLALVLARKDGTELLGACIFAITDTPMTKEKPQSEIDTELTKVMTADFWSTVYKAQGAQDVSITATGTREVGDRKVQTVTAEFQPKLPAGAAPFRVKSREEVHAIPGAMHDVGCVARVEKYDLAAADIEKILTSYDPRAGVVAQAPSNSSVATLFAKADFNGVARVLKGPTANVAEVSWPLETGSVAISGIGEWQVCEGANFTGACSTLVGARTAALNATLRIGSLRPLASTSPRGVASLVATNSGLLMNEAIGRLSAK